MTVGVSGREAHGRVHDGLVFDGGQSAQTGLPASSVVGPLDPGDDRDAQLLSGPPPLAVQDVLLQQGKERFHRGVIAGSADLAHRPDEVVTVQRVDELPGPELGAAVRMNDATGGVATPGNSVVQGVHREASLHSVADRVAHDAAGEHVFDGAEVELALIGLDSSSRRNGVNYPGLSKALIRSVGVSQSSALRGRSFSSSAIAASAPAS